MSQPSASRSTETPAQVMGREGGRPAKCHHEGHTHTGGLSALDGAGRQLWYWCREPLSSTPLSPDPLLPPSHTAQASAEMLSLWMNLDLTRGFCCLLTLGSEHLTGQAQVTCLSSSCKEVVGVADVHQLVQWQQAGHCPRPRWAQWHPLCTGRRWLLNGPTNDELVGFPKDDGFPKDEKADH